MQRAVHDHAMIRVADRTDLSGRATADEVDLDRFQDRIRKVCALVGATLILSAPAQAGPPPSIPAEIAALQAQVAALQTQVNAQQAQITSLQTQLAAVQSNNALLLGPFVSVNSSQENLVRGPNIIFTGANIHIRSGSGATDDNLSHGGSLTGLGNLIIGYDEVESANNRGGSHNLVVGMGNLFTSSAFGGLVVGHGNEISAAEASVSGGEFNWASANFSSVSGGELNRASGLLSTISGGVSNPPKP
jgi:hypothetical protein